MELREKIVNKKLKEFRLDLTPATERCKDIIMIVDLHLGLFWWSGVTDGSRTDAQKKMIEIFVIHHTSPHSDPSPSRLIHSSRSNNRTDMIQVS